MEHNQLKQRHQTYKKMARNGQTGMMVGEEMSEVTPAVTCSTPSFALPDAMTTETPPNAAFHAASSCTNTHGSCQLVWPTPGMLDTMVEAKKS